jgi:hypothetical protein
MEERPMGRGPRIVLLGDSVLMDSVADYLAERRVPGVLRRACASIIDQFELLKPDLILFELGQPYSDQVIALLQRRPGLTMIGLDLDSSRAIILGSYQRVIDTMEDLYQEVQAVMRKQERWPWGGEPDGKNLNLHS